MRAWILDFKDEISRPRGWALAGKVFGGMAAAFGAAFTIYSFVDGQRSAETLQITERMASIQADLLADNSLARMAGLRALENFATDPNPTRARDEAIRQRAWRFPREMLLESVRAHHFSQSTGGSPKSSAPSLSSPPSERQQVLKTLSGVGRLGWFSPADAADHDDRNVDFSWLAQADGRGDEALREVFTVLENFDFSSVQLERPILDCAPLTNAVFESADLAQPSFSLAMMRNVRFTNADLQYARFRGTALNASRFDGATISGSDFSNLPAGSPTCAGSERSTSDAVSVTRLDQADFHRARIYSSRFIGTSITASNFTDAVVSSVHFDNASLVGANFTGANVGSTSFKEADLNGATFANATFTNAEFEGAHLANASFVGARFTEASSSASLQTAADVTGANFSGVTGLSEAVVCSLIRRGAVVIADVDRWNTASRARRTAEQYMSARERDLVRRCAP